MSLPWDDLHPDTPTPTPTPTPPPPQAPTPPTPTPTPPANLPDTVTPQIDFGKILTDAFAQALHQAAGYAKDTAGHIIAGDTVDFGHPTITATTAQGKELVIADAKNRSWRTLIQGLAIDLMYGLIAALATLTNNDPMQKTTWILFAGLVIKTLIQSAVSYFARLRITPTIREKGDKVALMPFAVTQPAEKSSSWR